MMRERLLTVTIGDCRVDTFRSGGKGGQNQNKVESGVRVVHELSGAVGESREFRDQPQNKRAAFRRMAATPTFQRWLRAAIARRCGLLSPAAIVAEQMAPEHLRIDVRVDGRWQPEA
jgi:RF-1 domain